MWKLPAIGAWLLVVLLSSTSVHAWNNTISTRDVTANGLTFTCDWFDTDATSNVHQVLLLHGFAAGKSWWTPLLENWLPQGLALQVLSCDLRGYSPGATPQDIDSYAYGNFVDDVYALAAAVNVTKFHLMGHDHGAILGWLVAAENRNDAVLSYAALSVPHNDLLSAALCGPDNSFDADQVLASNHFNQWSLPDSATLNFNALTTMLREDYNVPLAASPTTMQPPLWWYHGGMPAYVALPRVVGPYEVTDDTALLTATRDAIPMDERPCLPQQTPTGPIHIPVLFVCGAQNPYLLCQHAYATPSTGLIPEYTTAMVPSCGHDFFLPQDCTEDDDNARAMRSLTDFVFSQAGTGVEIPAKPDGWAPVRNSTEAPTKSPTTTMTTTMTSSAGGGVMRHTLWMFLSAVATFYFTTMFLG